MFKFKYIVFVFLISFLFFQYFRYKNIQNQTFLSFFDYFHDLSLQKRENVEEIKFLVGFEFIKYSIFKKLKINKEEIIKNNQCHFDIESLSDVECALIKSKRNNINTRYFVKNETLFKNLMMESGNRYAQRLSGSGINMARQLAHINNTRILFAAKMDSQTSELLPNNVKVILSSINKRMGLRKSGLIVNQLDNSRVIFDRAGVKTILEDIDLLNNDLVKEFRPHCIVIGRFPLFKDEFNERMLSKIKDMSKSLSLIPTNVVIHHQMGLVDNIDGGIALVQNLIPHLDSIDLGLRELHQLYSLVNRGDINITDYSSDVETSVSILQDLWRILTSGSFSSKPGMRKISRIHLQGHDYHILMLEPQATHFFMNLRHALAKGLMAKLYSRCGRKLAMLKEKIHFHLEDEFFLSRNLTLSPIQCWSHSTTFEVCVSPVPTCLDLTFPLENGESAAAASLVSQIKLPY